MLYGVDEKCTTTSTDVTLIIPNLYLGSVEAACNTDHLKQLGITHILTVEDRPLAEKFTREFKYKYICVFDLPLFDVFSVFDECFNFIDEGTKSPCAILIHCLLGVSRSATILLAYLMSKQKRNLNELYEFVKQKRYIRPNNGFIKQLEIFEAMNYKIERDSLIYKSYMLDKMVEHVKKGANINDIYENIEHNNNQNNQNNNQISHYKCKKCRHYLFNINNRIKHLKSYEYYDNDDWNSKLNYYKKLNHTQSINGDNRTSLTNGNSNGNNIECSKEIFIEPVNWFVDKISELEGKINCPKCDSKIGSYNWYGQKCACSTWVVPAFHIYETKVDLCNPLPTLPNVINRQFAHYNTNNLLVVQDDDDDDNLGQSEQIQKVVADQNDNSI